MSSTLLNPYAHIIRVMRSCITKAQLQNAKSWALNVISSMVDAGEISFDDFLFIEEEVFKYAGENEGKLL